MDPMAMATLVLMPIVIAGLVKRGDYRIWGLMATIIQSGLFLLYILLRIDAIDMMVAYSTIIFCGLWCIGYGILVHFDVEKPSEKVSEKTLKEEDTPIPTADSDSTINAFSPKALFQQKKPKLKVDTNVATLTRPLKKALKPFSPKKNTAVSKPQEPVMSPKKELPVKKSSPKNGRVRQVSLRKIALENGSDTLQRSKQNSPPELKVSPKPSPKTPELQLLRLPLDK